jgi:pyruvate,water dikinase
MYGIDIYDYNEERDGKYCWVSGDLWAWPPWAPLMFLDWAMGAVQLDGWASYEAWSIPSSRGYDARYKNGHVYMTSLTTDEEERKQREPIFMAKTAKVMEDPFGFWDSAKPEFKQTIDRLHPFDVEKASDAELAYHVVHCCAWTRRQAELHFHIMSALGGLTLLFRDMLFELTKIAPSDVKFSKLMSGFDNMLYHANKGLGELATHAMELGLRNIFDTLDPAKVPAELEKSDKGREWLKQFKEYLKVYGIRPLSHGISAPIWLEKPEIPLLEVKRMMDIGGVHAPDFQRERLVKEREEAEKEVLAMVPAEKRELLGKLMKCAQAWGYFQEDHVYYCEFSAFGLLRRVAIEAGKRLVKAKVFDEPEDAIYLFRHELVEALGVKNRCGARDIMKKRKEEYQGYLKMGEAPMVIGDASKFVEMVRGDPVLAIGISAPIAKPEEVGATVVGAAGAPGVVEGIARVIMSVHELDQIQTGEILVTLSTSPEWVPVFSIVKAVVADLGGPLAHAVIVSREYGMPAVVGTMEATKKIKTGQRIKVDGNTLRVYVLD